MAYGSTSKKDIDYSYIGFDIKNFDSNLITKAILKQVSSEKYISEYVYGDGQAGKRIAKKLEDLKLTFKKVISY